VTDAAATPRSDITVSAVITRADGRVEHVGIIAASYDRPLKRLWWEVVGQRLANRRIKRANRRA
jgi:hypothetical protein